MAEEEHHPIEFDFPDISRWRQSASGTDYVHVLDSGVPGPVVMVNALTHGNEVSGAVVVDTLLASGLKPRRGSLVLSFANVAAYQTFRAEEPFKSRMLDEDFNRVWGRIDDPPGEKETREMVRARALLPHVQRADLLLDLHSMHDDCVPLMLCGPLDKGVELARQVGAPLDVVRDRGHAAGRRMRDYGGFGDPTARKNALLIETGQHWRASSVVGQDVTARFLALSGAVEPMTCRGTGASPIPTQRIVQVTQAVATRAATSASCAAWAGRRSYPRPARSWPRRGEPVHTPYDDCVLDARQSRVRPGVTIVRLGRIVG